MELLYVWIEDYKNIYRQGFNFSPKYRFHFDYESKELTCEENTDFIDDFFGNEISNVTAIIGENGSGKSTVLEFLQNIHNFNTEYNFFTVFNEKNKEIIYYPEQMEIKTTMQKMVIESRKLNKGKKFINYLFYVFADYGNNYYPKNSKGQTISFSNSLNFQFNIKGTFQKKFEEFYKKSQEKQSDIVKLYLNIEVKQQIKYIFFCKEKELEIPFELPKELNLRFSLDFNLLKNLKSDKHLLELSRELLGANSDDVDSIFKNIQKLLDNIFDVSTNSISKSFTPFYKIHCYITQVA